ncbi:MAG TPA: hypothetical protein VKV24_00930 [Casimicrobiaceae bacterium]|nr:hypothetical protein [Casimicrobiaceae bacterium]
MTRRAAEGADASDLKGPGSILKTDRRVKIPHFNRTAISGTMDGFAAPFRNTW